MVTGRSMGLVTSGVAMATSKNNGSPLLGLKELDTSEVPGAQAAGTVGDVLVGKRR